MFQETSIIEQRKHPYSDPEALGFRVLVMRRWPRGCSSGLVDAWLPSAGPSIELLSSLLQKEIIWETFVARYQQEQWSQISCRITFYEQGSKRNVQRSHSALKELCLLEQQYSRVTVMCWEAAGKPCHRHVLLKMLQGSE